MHVPCSCPRTWRRRPAPLTLVRSWNVGKWWHKCLRPLSAEHLLGSACLVWSCIVLSRLLRAVSLEHLTLSLSLTRAAIGVGLSQQSSMGLLSRVPLFTAPRLVHSFSPHISVCQLRCEALGTRAQLSHTQAHGVVLWLVLLCGWICLVQLHRPRCR